MNERQDNNVKEQKDKISYEETEEKGVENIKEESARDEGKEVAQLDVI